MSRLIRFQGFWVVAFSILTLRLSYLQILRGGHYRRLAEQNRLRLVSEQAPRGLIVDREGRVLATSQTTFRIAVVPQETRDPQRIFAAVSPLVHQPVEALQREYARSRSTPYMPATIASRVPKEVAIRLEEERWRTPGLLVRQEMARRYPGGNCAAHLLGYLSQPTAEEWPLLKHYGIRPYDLVGRMGIERLFDEALRGRSGGMMVEVNHQGRQVRMLGRRTPQAGEKVVLTIDAQLQSLIEQAFGTQPGACVVLNPETGAVLAMVSQPAFAPEAFIGPDRNTVQGFLTDASTPLLNRATVGTYQPGSIAKLITAIAALEHGLITPSTVIHCPGSLTIGDRTFRCWNRDGHGSLTLADAVMQSCNVYFMQVGRRLGVSRLRAAMEQAGLSHRTGWPMEEQSGHLPQRRLTEGEVALLSIGQGELLVTVVQAAVIASAFANGGWVAEPWVVSAIGGHSVESRVPRRRLGWSAASIRAVRGGMQAVVRNPAGTGHRAFTEAVSIAGKTGTAQTHVPGRTHGWFVGFCPVEQPRAALAVMAEYGGSGGELPTEIARHICEYLAWPRQI